MKKNLFLISVVALALGACSNDTTLEQNTATELQPAEIAFSPLNQNLTRAEVEGTTFPTGQDMYVAAYDATKGADYFGQTTFDEDGTTGKWKANPPKYWPMNAATLNFLAYTGVPSGSYFNATHPAQDLTITLADNSSNQYDLMYACGRQSRALNTAASDVAMNFKHALALIKFEVKTAADYSYGSPKVYPLAITSIVLTGAHYSGTYTIDNSTNYSSTSSTYSTLVGVWSSVGTQANVTRTPSFSNLTTSFQQVGNGILVVPDEDNSADDYTSFTINYTLDGKAYSYDYTPADLDVHQAKKYTFQITMTLNEIIIAPTVTDYVEENDNTVAIQ